MRKSPTLLSLSLGASVLAASWLASSGAEAQRLRAQVYLTQHRQPASVRTERQLVAWARGSNARRLMETTDAPLEERYWTAEMVVAFNRPVDDLEFHVLYYDVHDGARRFVDDMTVMISDRSQKTFVQRARLRRPQFKPNRRMEMVITVRREEVATSRFEVIGEEERRSGVVSFSDDEATGRSERQQRGQPPAQTGQTSGGDNGSPAAAGGSDDSAEADPGPATDDGGDAPASSGQGPGVQTAPGEGGCGSCRTGAAPDGATSPLVIVWLGLLFGGRRLERRRRLGRRFSPASRGPSSR